MERYLVERPWNTVEVVILPHVIDNKYSFVNLTEGHICKCKFETIEEALADMDMQVRLGNVIKFTKLDN